MMVMVMFLFALGLSNASEKAKSLCEKVGRRVR
jgi:hypothetical protein